MLAAIASTTKRIKLGSLVTPVTAYAPIALLKRVLTVQLISKNRTMLGLGAGWYSDEFYAFGAKFRPHGVRTEMLEEALQLMKMVWDSRRPISYEGKYYSARNAVLRPRSAIPPLWLGGTSDGILKLVAKHGDGWIPYEIGQVEFSDRLSRLTRFLDRFHRRATGVRLALATRIVARKSADAASQFLRSARMKRDFISQIGQKAHIIAGSYEQCAEEISGYLQRGVDTLVLSPQPIDMIEEHLLALKDQVISKIT